MSIIVKQQKTLDSTDLVGFFYFISSVDVLKLPFHDLSLLYGGGNFLNCFLLIVKAVYI